MRSDTDLECLEVGDLSNRYHQMSSRIDESKAQRVAELLGGLLLFVAEPVRCKKGKGFYFFFKTKRDR